MKILAISNYVGDPKLKHDSAIHLWRIKRPMLELQKQTGWQVDFQTGLIRDFKGLELDPEKFVKKHGISEIKHLSQYDIIYTSYFTSPHIYTLLWGLQQRYATKVIIDFDDDLFDVDPSNFAFWKSAGKEGHLFLGIIARVAKYITTTNEGLAKKIGERSEVDPSIYVVPNYISDMYPDREVDNGDRIYIGFFGGASHYTDVHHSNFLEATARVMHEHKNVFFKICGQPVDSYLPKKRIINVDVAQGAEWPTKRLPSMNLDIACAPLLVTEFNQHKSNIKWQEATRMGSAFVGTNTGPYKGIPENCGILVENTIESWYEALKSLVEDAKKRKEMVKCAKEELKKWRLEDNVMKYKEMFEEVTK